MSHVILDPSVPFNWNGILIQFDAWPDDAFGIYDYTTRNRRHWIEYRLQSSPAGVEIVLLRVDRNPPALTLSGTYRRNNNVLLRLAPGVTPTTVPHALLLLVIWAESVGFQDSGGRHG